MRLYSPAAFADLSTGLKAVTLEQIKSFHGRHYGAAKTTIALVGDFDAVVFPEELTNPAIGGVIPGML